MNLQNTVVVVLCLMILSACEAEPEPLSQTADDSTVASHGSALFQEVALDAGLDFTHFSGATGEYYFPEMAGAGIALFDFDGDGDLDVYLLQGFILDASDQAGEPLFPLPEKPGNRFFRNEIVPDGRLRFVDVTESAGVMDAGYAMGAAVGDTDNDGDPDLYVTNFGANVFYRNNGDGTFSDITAQSGADDPRWSTSAAFLDYDRDGDLDFFFTNYVFC